VYAAAFRRITPVYMSHTGMLMLMMQITS